MPVDYNQYIYQNPATTFELTAPALTVTFSAGVSVYADGTIHCTQKLTPDKFEIAVKNAGEFGGLLRAIWIAGNCNKQDGKK